MWLIIEEAAATRVVREAKCVLHIFGYLTTVVAFRELLEKATTRGARGFGWR